MIYLSTTYMGMKLRTPLVPSASPLTQEFDSVRRLEDTGAAAIVFHSLFEEAGRGGGEEPSRLALDHYVSHLRRAKESLAIPVIASLCGTTPAGWVEYARQIEQSGANAIELNLYQIPSEADIPGAQLENKYIEIVTSVKSAIRIPVAAKLTPFFTSMANMAKCFDAAGGDARGMFNRFYQPDFDIEALEVRPSLHFSTPSELLPRLHWAAILYGHTNMDIGVTGGVHSAEDVLKSIMAGGSVAMMASALHIHGIEHIRRVLSDMQYWLEKREYTCLAETRGCLSRRSVPDTSPFDRGNYIKTLSSYSLRPTVAAF